MTDTNQGKLRKLIHLHMGESWAKVFDEIIAENALLLSKFHGDEYEKVKELRKENAKIKAAMNELRQRQPSPKLKKCFCPYPSWRNVGGAVSQCSHCGGWDQ